MFKLLAILLSMSLMACTDISSQDASKKKEKIVGIKFPQISAETLAGTKIILPDAAQGQITLITIAFKREAQPQLDSWLRPFMEEYGDNPGFTFYEIPMLAWYWKLMGWMIDSGMRSGIQKEKHKNVMTYYGNYSIYRQMLGLDDVTFGYAFLLDRKGIIRWYERGYATKGEIREMLDWAERLAQEGKQDEIRT
jgi:hypothetical protein